MLESLAEMTWRNPIFMLVFFAAIWFLPGIVIRRISQSKYEQEKAKQQLRKIESLYPKR